MKISTMTVRQALDAMGSEASDAEAKAMIAILNKTDYEDTTEISDEDWRAMMDCAISDATA